MQRTDLLAYDVVPSELEQLRSALPDRLLPLQALAVRRGLLRGLGSAVIAGPPGAGQRGLAALCTLHAEREGQRVLVLRAADGQQQLDQLSRQPQLLATADVVIIDGLEALRDRELGPPLAALLGQVRRQQQQRLANQQPPLRLLGFSLLVDGLAALAEQLGAELIADQQLPRPLSIGVVAAGQVRWQSLGPSPQAGSPPSLLLPPAVGPSLPDLLGELVRQRQSTLVICPDAARCIRLAVRLTERLGSPGPVPLALSELDDTAAGRGRTLLATTLRYGVAIFSPDLTPGQQAVVERAVERGEVRLLCAVGVPPLGLCRQFPNLLLSNRWRWQRGTDGERWQRSPWDHLDCLRLAARSRQPEGRLLVYARSPAEAEQIWQQLLAPPLPLASLSLPGTPLAAAGLAIWQRWAQASRTAAGLSRLELLTICALGPSSSSLPLLLSEQVGGDYAGQLLELADRLGLSARPLFRWLQRPAEQLGHQTLRAIKQALLLHDWAAGLAGAELEAKFQVFTGTIGRVASEAADRLDWLAEVSAQVGFGAAEQQPLHELGEVLRQRPVDGVAEHAPLASPVPGLSRTIGCLVGALHAKAGGPVAAAAPTAQTPPRRAAWQRTGS